MAIAHSDLEGGTSEPARSRAVQDPVGSRPSLHVVGSGVLQRSALESPLVVASNRGPYSFIEGPDGGPRPRRGSGGLVTALAGVLFEADATWVAAAMTDLDRAAANEDRPLPTDSGGQMRFLDVPPDAYDGFYNRVSNEILWFAHHSLWNVPEEPVFDQGTTDAWGDYRRVNERFAELLAEAGDDPVFLVQDYQLTLVPAMLRLRRPRARIVHYSHTPFAGPESLCLLPTRIVEEMLRGILGADVVGFQSERWADNFLRAVRSLSGLRVDLRRRRVYVDGRTVLVRVYPVALDPHPLREAALRPAVEAERRRLEDLRGDGQLIVRVDRLELSKNALRGFLAYESFLRENPDRHGEVRFFALLPPSRTEVPAYRRYAERTLAEVDRINRTLGGRSWRPIEVSTEESYETAVAAYGAYDALLVNPVFDGMNLVAMEGPLVSRRKGALVLSRNTGAWQRLGRHSLGVNPFDIAETAEAIERALSMPSMERVQRARGLTRQTLANTPVRWLTRQLTDIDVATGQGDDVRP
jgi:trehalose 6-phosphate synthase